MLVSMFYAIFVAFFGVILGVIFFLILFPVGLVILGYTRFSIFTMFYALYVLR